MTETDDNPYRFRPAAADPVVVTGSQVAAKLRILRGIQIVVMTGQLGFWFYIFVTQSTTGVRIGWVVFFLSMVLWFAALTIAEVSVFFGRLRRLEISLSVASIVTCVGLTVLMSGTRSVVFVLSWWGISALWLTTCFRRILILQKQSS